jgi:hypothetical protein
MEESDAMSTWTKIALTLTVLGTIGLAGVLLMMSS